MWDLYSACSPSGRSILTEKAVAKDLDWLRAFFDGAAQAGVRTPASSVLRLDDAGRNALDYALEARQKKAVTLLLSAVWAAPPLARAHLAKSLIECARRFPSLLADELEASRAQLQKSLQKPQATL